MHAYQTHNFSEHYELKTYLKLFTCDGCKTKGFGERYRCELHRECRFPHTTVSHEFFGCSTLTFRDEPFTRYGKNNPREYSKCCDACGSSYHCAADNLDLHPTCRNLDRKLVINDTVFDLLPAKRSSSKCIWCKKRKISDGTRDVAGWSYLSTCKKYHFHVYCMTEMVKEGGDGIGENAAETVDQVKIVVS